MVIIGGPTAVGKSKLSLALKNKNNGVLVNGDATKLYRGLEGGANKRPAKGVDVRLWDVVDAVSPGVEFSAGQYHDAACAEIDHIISVEKKLPIVVGGSGLYIRWLMRGKQAGPQRDRSISSAILHEIIHLPWSEVISMIQAFDPKYAEKVAENDYRRAARAIELHRRTGSSIQDLQRQRSGALHDSENDTSKSTLETLGQDKKESAGWQAGIDFRPYVLSLPRTQLYDTICRRCENMILDGLFMEVWGLMRRGLTAESTPGKAIGYRQTIDFLNARFFTEESFMNFLYDFQSKTRQLAHRQLSWFRKEPDFLNIPLNDDTAQVMSSHLLLSQKDWIDLVKSQNPPTKEEIDADLAPLRLYQPPSGLLILPRLNRKNQDSAFLQLAQTRQTLINRQLMILEQILFEMERANFVSPKPTISREDNAL